MGSVDAEDLQNVSILQRKIETFQLGLYKVTDKPNLTHLQEMQAKLTSSGTIGGFIAVS